MVNIKHNPGYRLVQTTIFMKGCFLDLVYSIANDGTNEGLEIYYKKRIDGHFHRSFRYTEDNLPKKYLYYFEFLKQFDLEHMINDGCKIIVDLPLN